MLTLNFNPFPTITTERLVLRKFEKNDIQYKYKAAQRIFGKCYFNFSIFRGSYFIPIKAESLTSLERDLRFLIIVYDSFIQYLL